jgi:DNA topoisomerase-1
MHDDPAAAARAVALTCTSDDAPGIARLRPGKSFRYTVDGKPMRAKATLSRIRALAIPPAWTDRARSRA